MHERERAHKHFLLGSLNPFNTHNSQCLVVVVVVVKVHRTAYNIDVVSITHSAYLSSCCLLIERLTVDRLAKICFIQKSICVFLLYRTLDTMRQALHRTTSPPLLARSKHREPQNNFFIFTLLVYALCVCVHGFRLHYYFCHFYQIVRSQFNYSFSVPACPFHSVIK